MPRRNHPARRTSRRPPPAPSDTTPRSTDAMACDLVRRGLASPLVLGRPLFLNTRWDAVALSTEHLSTARNHHGVFDE